MFDSHYTVAKVAEFLEPTTLKVIIGACVSIGLFFFGHLYFEAIKAIMFLFVFDFILGLAASYYEKKEITSKKASASVKKGIIYLLGISAGYFTDLTIPFDFVQGTMIAFVGFTEFVSILENMGRLGYKTPQKMLNKLRKERDNL